MCSTIHDTHTHTLITPAPALADNLARRITVANLPEREREPSVCVLRLRQGVISGKSAQRVQHAACAGRGQQQHGNNAQHSGCRWPKPRKRQQNCYGDNDNDNAPAMAKALLLLLLHT